MIYYDQTDRLQQTLTKVSISMLARDHTFMAYKHKDQPRGLEICQGFGDYCSFLTGGQVVHKLIVFRGCHIYMATKHIYLVWCLQLVMEESGVIFVLKQIMKLIRSSNIHEIRMSFRSRSLVVSDFRSKIQVFPVRVQLLDRCRGEISGIISQLIFECL